MAGHGVLFGHFPEVHQSREVQGLAQSQQSRLGKLTKWRAAWRDRVPTPRSPREGLICLPREPARPRSKRLAGFCLQQDLEHSTRLLPVFSAKARGEQHRLCWLCDGHGTRVWRCWDTGKHFPDRRRGPGGPHTVSNLPVTFGDAGAGTQVCGVPVRSQCPSQMPRRLQRSVLLWSAPRWHSDKKWLKPGNSMFL